MDNKPLAKMDVGSMEKVFEPKAYGAWFLHKHTSSDNLTAFLLFSSVGALIGSAGSGNYIAANTYLDELAQWRSNKGMPAVSVQWPAVKDSAASKDVKAGSKKKDAKSTID